LKIIHRQYKLTTTKIRTIYSQFAPLPIHPSNQLTPRKYGASWHPVLPAKLVATIY